MGKRYISDRAYQSAKNHINQIKHQYEEGVITDEQLLVAEIAFYHIDEAYQQQPRPAYENYPDAENEQLLFEELCDMVGMSRQNHGEHSLDPGIIAFANRRIWSIIDELSLTWDKGDIYYPHVRNPNLRHALVHDLFDAKRRKNARARNRSDMARRRPYRGAQALMADPT